MIRKRGGIHADWIVSLAIFIVAIVFLLTLIKPGEEQFDPTSLFNLVEQRLDGTINYKINRTQIFPQGSADRIQINLPADAGDFAYVYEGGGPFVFQPIAVSPLTVCNHPLIFLLNSDNLYSSGTTADSCGPTVANAIFGATELLEGINDNYFQANSLCSDENSYSTLKELWKFPKNNEFRITLTNTAEFPVPAGFHEEVICGVKEPYQQADVYVKDKRVWMLNKDSTKTGARLHIEVW